jgi:tryptophanyl-tRNA synthetase
MTATLSTAAPTTPRARRFTGLKPTGHLHLGNLIGAIEPMVAEQYGTESVIMVADLHALTVPHEPHRVRALTTELSVLLLSAGIDPDRTLLYLQSRVPEHAELHYLLECVTGYGEAHRMIQFRERAARAGHAGDSEHAGGSRQAELAGQADGTGRGPLRLSLLTYPVLMAADILLHDAAEVPVGHDQTQHLELAQAVATRFNHRYGPTFVVPRAVNPPVAARIMDLSDPSAKMGKSTDSTAGTIYLLDPPGTVRRKIARAVTDGQGSVRHDPQGQPGVTNLLEILAGCTGGSPAALAAGFTGYGQLKSAVAEAVNALLHPLQARHAELVRDPAYVQRVLDEGAERARDAVAGTVHRAQRAIGLR